MDGPRRRVLTSGVVAALLISHLLAARTSALTCVDHGDDMVAAMEALAGDHPLWADAYVVGRVEAVDRPADDAVRIVLTPTHAFGVDQPETIRLAARLDGPPDPSMWAVGGLYFVSLSDADGIENADAFAAPCAPNFPITEAGQLDQLADAAGAVTVLDGGALPPPSLQAPLLGVFALVLAALVSWRAFRRRSSGDPA